MGDQLVLLARGVLAGGGDLRPDQHVRARILLDMALELKPKEAEVWRLRYDLARAADDADGQIKALKQYVKLFPTDDAAQLEYVRLLVEQDQHIEQRLERVESILDSSGAKRLTEALRSRLASYCARAATEIGDVERFSKRVRQALALDKTNKEAARMLLDHVQAQRPSPKRLGIALMWRIQAAPLDVKPRLQLAQLLLTHRAYGAATSQFGIAQRNANGPLDAQSYHDWALSMAALGGPYATRNALSILANFEASLQGPPEDEEEEEPGMAVEEIGKDKKEDEEQEKEHVNLPMDLELLRLAIVHHSKIGSSHESAFARIRDALTEKVPDDNQAAVDLAWLAAWLGPQAPDEDTIQNLEAEHGADNWVIQRIRAWMALRDGAFDDARQNLEQLDRSDPFTLYGLAHTYGEQRSDPQRIELLEKVTQSWPVSLAGMLAARDLAEAQKPVEATPDAQALVRLLEEWPSDLREPNPAALPWTTVELHIDPKRFVSFQGVTGIVTVRNATDVPLAVGPDGTIPSRLFLYTKSRTAGRMIGTTPPIVVDVRRRLRLGPGEVLGATVRLDHHDFGVLLRNNPFEMIDFNVTAMLDPRPMPDGKVRRGILGGQASQDYLQCWGEPLTPENIDKWLKSATDTDPVNRMIAVARLEYASVRVYNEIKNGKRILERLEREAEEEEALREAEEEADDPQDDKNKADLTPEQIDHLREQIAKYEERIELTGQAVNDQFPRMDRVEQAWSLLFLPRTEETVELFAPVYDRVERSNEQMLRITYLAVHVRTPNSTLLTDALREPDELVVQYAQAIQDAFDFVAAQRAKNQ